MKTVFIYAFQGQYTGKTEYEYENPDISAVHKCMLFLSQDSEEHQFNSAQIEIKKYGFDNVENLTGNPLKTEALNSQQFVKFSAFYEEALDSGSSLIYYPNT